ncbi:hypothetical protein ONZ45_g889 [Pleurotus djamor]|nr:hypothetical protein ONZ45_g889 [Pleurotus djamor]
MPVDQGPKVEVLLYGATIISWKTVTPGELEATERLFVSSKAALDGSKPVRGGIPVVFPCFGAPTHATHAKLSQHGFARSSKWTLGSVVTDNETAVSVKLSLSPTPEIKAVYEQDFELIYDITLAEHQLTTDLHVTNTGNATLEFQALLHTYLRAPANEVTIRPLEGLKYYDKVVGAEKIETRPDVEVKSFTDSVYEDAPGAYQIRWPTGGFDVQTAGFKDVVVWNPQAEAGSKIGDMEINGWEKYVCVEPGYVKGFAQLVPGDKWLGRQVIQAVLSTSHL